MLATLTNLIKGGENVKKLLKDPNANIDDLLKEEGVINEFKNKN